MKILFYIHDLSIGGAETLVVNYLKILKDNHNVAVVVNRRVGSFLEDCLGEANIPIYSLSKGFRNIYIINKVLYLYSNLQFVYTRRWGSILSTFKPDIIHIHTALSKFPTKLFNASKLVFTFHSELDRFLSLVSKETVDKLHYLASRGMHFIAINKMMAKKCETIFNSKNVSYIPNGVDFTERITTDRSNFLNRHNIPEYSYILGHVGRFHRVKNQQFIVDIFNEIHKIRKDSYLFFVGSGDKTVISEVRQRVIEYDLEDNVIFWGVQNDPLEFINVFDCLLLPSLSESFSLVLIEAQSLGVKCVTSTAVPVEVLCNDNCSAVSLSAPINEWVDTILSGSVRTSPSNKLRQFEIGTVVNKMVELYSSL